MGQHYDQPRRLNVVSVTLLLAAIAGGYLAIQYLPHYYRKWKAAGVLSESVNKIYPSRNLAGAAESEFMDRLRKETEGRLRELGIRAPAITITFTKDPKTISGTVQYDEEVKHWFVGKVSIVRFNLTESIKATSD